MNEADDVELRLIVLRGPALRNTEGDPEGTLRMILCWQANDLLLVLVPGRHDHRVILARQWPSVEVAIDFPSREAGDA